MAELLRAAGSEKVVLFCQPVETVAVVAREIEVEFGERPAIIIGGQTDPERDEQVARFRDRRGARFLVSSRAGGEGINLQVARRLLHLDVPWNPMDLEQRVGRVHRFGARRTIVVDTLVVAGTRETDAYAAERIHGDDTTVPVLAKGKTITGRVWTYVRDDRPFGGPAPPAAVFFYSRDRTAEHPNRHLADYAGILQADAYAGFNDLYAAARRPGPVTEAACWAHGRRKFFPLAELARAPLAIEAVRRIDAIFDVERSINGVPAEQRLAIRKQHVAAMVSALETWMRIARSKMSRHADVAKAMDYMLKRWPTFSRFVDDGRICMTNNAAERALRGIALGRKSWLFAGSDRGGERAAAMYSLIVTAKLNDVDPRAWLADVLARIADHPASRLHELLPWHWAQSYPLAQAA